MDGQIPQQSLQNQVKKSKWWIWLILILGFLIILGLVILTIF